MSRNELLKRYIIPVLICIIVVIVTIKIQYWFDGLYNDRAALHSIINMINTGQIEVKKK